MKPTISKQVQKTQATRALSSGNKYSVYATGLGLVLTTFCASSQADVAINVPDANLALYGRVASGVSYVDKIGAASDSVFRAASNEWGTSLLGLKGSKEFAPGIQGEIKLETGFSAANGNSNAGNLFSRFATVGIKSKDAGTIEFGRSLAYSNDAWNLDPMGMNWSGVDSLSKGHNWGTWNNTVGYRSPNLSGFEAGLQLSLGGQPGNNSAGRSLAATLSYTLDNLNVRAIYDETRDANGKLSDLFNFSSEYIVGATYKIQSTTLFAAINRISASGAALGSDTAMNHGWVGANYQLNPDNLVRVAVFTAKTDVTNAKANLYTVGWDHKVNSALSLWASAALMDNNKNAAFPAVGYWQDAPVPGAAQHGINAGFIYSF